MDDRGRETALPAAGDEDFRLSHRRFHREGGVGKTSVAAHLAGALMHQGRSAVLVDCDSQKNLSLLLDEGVDDQDKRGNLSTLVIEKYESFDDANYPKFFIVYDCAPKFDTNDPKIFKHVTDTVIPIVLSPLSVLGNWGIFLLRPGGESHAWRSTRE